MEPIVRVKYNAAWRPVAWVSAPASKVFVL